MVHELNKYFEKFGRWFVYDVSLWRVGLNVCLGDDGNLNNEFVSNITEITSRVGRTYSVARFDLIENVGALPAKVKGKADILEALTSRDM